jgi:two-component system phosphate regulon sensor histidine kinase PhoR
VQRLQRKLVLALAGLVMIVVTVSGIFAERGLRERTLERIEQSLIERAELAAELVATLPFEVEEIAKLDALADRAGQAAQARVTLIAADGRVLGDSDVVVSELVNLENHRSRPGPYRIRGRVSTSHLGRLCRRCLKWQPRRRGGRL